jgi:bacterioferritin-associated ferredoxin
MAILCSCTGATDRAIKHAIDSGACTVSGVRSACGAASRCGTCRTWIEALLNEPKVALSDAVTAA